MAAQPTLTPQGRQPVENYDASTLHRLLVEDAVKGVATYLPWAIAAYSRIGTSTRRGAEDAYQAVLDEVESLTSSRRMPMSSTTTKAELDALLRPL